MEIMVALVIGLIGIMIVLQIFSNAERQRRITSGTGDANSSGALALYSLQRDVRKAGFGVGSLNLFGCPLNLPAPASRQLSALAPVRINPPVADVPAGDVNTDTLLMVFGNGSGNPEGDRITSVATVGTDQQLGVVSATNFAVGHRVVAGPATPTLGCQLTMASITSASTPNLTIPNVDASEGGLLFNLGSAPRVLAYAIRGGSLMVCDYTQSNCGQSCTAGNAFCNSNWVSIASNVVSMRVQYGRDTTTPMDGIDTWDQTTPVQPIPPNQDVYSCRWARISAVRLAIVTRNSEPDRDVVTQNAPTWAGSDDVEINLTARSNWQNYRYQVFETVIPLRNLPWMATCT